MNGSPVPPSKHMTCILGLTQYRPRFQVKSQPSYSPAQPAPLCVQLLDIFEGFKPMIGSNSNPLASSLATYPFPPSLYKILFLG